jgi:hypothetical protein
MGFKIGARYFCGSDKSCMQLPKYTPTHVKMQFTPIPYFFSRINQITGGIQVHNDL